MSPTQTIEPQFSKICSSDGTFDRFLIDEVKKTDRILNKNIVHPTFKTLSEFSFN